MYQTHYNVLSMQTVVLILTDWLYVRDTVGSVMNERNQLSNVKTSVVYAHCDYPLILTTVGYHRAATSVLKPVVYVSAAQDYQLLLQQENLLLDQPPCTHLFKSVTMLVTIHIAFLWPLA